MADVFWRQVIGEGPMVATAIHDGHELREEVRQAMALDDHARFREEDPFTSEWVEVAPTQIVVGRSRFEVDLNRPRERAVYRGPEDAWGLSVWHGALDEEIARRSLAQYDAFYEAISALLSEVHRRTGKVLVLDLHSYNHRRDGPDAAPADPQANPQVNVGTGTVDRVRWGSLIDRFIADLARFDFPGGALDVRENVKFRGGHFSRWVHATFPNGACVLAIEFKKFFMDEWTGVPDRAMIRAIGRALASTVPGLLSELERA